MDESKKKDRYEDAKKFVRYSDGAKMYSMGMTKFQEVAKDAKACYKIGQLVLVNTEILDKYLETFHITDSEFYKYSYKCYSDTKDFMKKFVNAEEGAIIYGTLTQRTLLMAASTHFMPEMTSKTMPDRLL